jgi:hypothetical protein
MDSTDGLGFIQHHAQPDVLLEGVRKNVVAQLEARRSREPVDRRHVLEEVVAGGLHGGGGGANLSGAMVSVSSPVEFGIGQRLGFQARIALIAGCSGSPSRTAALPPMWFESLGSS